MAAGLVVGETHAIDSAPVKANASLDSLHPKPARRVVDDTQAPIPLPAVTPATPAHELRRVATRQAKQQRGGGDLGAHHVKAQLLSNKTHTSGSDPEARISVKPGKARALNYFCSLAVDTASSLISHVQANLADSRDSIHLPRLVEQLQARLTAQRVPLREVLSDAGYSNGFNYDFLE